MSDKLRDAIDNIQGLVDDFQEVTVSDYEDLQKVIEAAWRYWDMCDEDDDE